MNTGRILVWVVVGMLATGYWLIGSGQAQTGGGGGLNVVAVVNIPQVFRDSAEINALKKEFTAASDKLKIEADASKTALEQLQAKLKDMNPESKDYRDAQEELLSQSIKARITLEMKQQNMITQHQVRTEAFYKKISDKINQVALGDGFQLVLYKEDYEVKNARNPDELLEMIRQRKVLYNSARAELTAKVIEKLNADFAGPAPK